ncbi:MAG TPA: ribonuclease H-like domain-containing protein [Candidatus Binatia bacterium]|nr:ribonuclease H-like domain-containing protein [Candidatus Binatia bacterium]
MAATLDGEIVRTARGTVVRRDVASIELPLDRARLASLPGQPPATAPLVCLDTETTGLATASGTVAFLVGVGTWHGTAFRQVQLLLPEHPDEPALLAALAGLIPADAWLVTYNGRGFDWPLLVARYRMDRRSPPPLAGHLDLLPVVRRLFRHRLPDARLKTAEADLLAVRRHDDVEGWEIPGRYLDFVRGGSAAPLVEVVRHNELDVRSLAGLLAHLDRGLADPDRLPDAPWGDLAGLARMFRRERRHDDALRCLEAALQDPRGTCPRRDRDAIAAERARTLRRLGRHGEALESWRRLADGGGPLTGVAMVEIAKALEHTWADPAGALEVVERGAALTGRARALGRPMPILEADLSRRRTRLTERLRRRRIRRLG